MVSKYTMFRHLFVLIVPQGLWYMPLRLEYPTMGKSRTRTIMQYWQCMTT